MRRRRIKHSMADNVLFSTLRHNNSDVRDGEADWWLLRRLRRLHHRSPGADHRQQLRQLLQEQALEGRGGPQEKGAA